MISSQETYLLRLISCVEHVVASQKQIADLKGPSLLRKLEKIRKWKKEEKIKCNSNLPFKRNALNCLPWQSWPESRQSANVTRRTFSFVGKQGDLRGEREIGVATPSIFLAQFTFFGLFCLAFSSFFLSFFSKIKSCPNNFIYVFSLRWWISNYYL